MKIQGLNQIKKVFRWLRGRFTGGGMILLYHRVADLTGAADPFSLCVTPQNFSNHMAAIRELGNPMTLEDMTDAMKNDQLPRRAFVVTFDDGYVDNLNYAKPILERYNIPATVFVISGYLGQMFWWDKMTNAIFKPEMLPQKLHLQINGASQEFKIQDSNLKSRRKLLRRVHRYLRLMPKKERDSTLINLSTQTGTDPLSTCDNHRALTKDELNDLSSGGLIEIGAHSVTHPALAELSIHEQEKEIGQSKMDLEEIIDKPVTSFSYPYGLPTDYSVKTLHLLRVKGFKRACSSDIDLVRRHSDIFQLPRYWVQNWSCSHFFRRVNRWIGSN